MAISKISICNLALTRLGYPALQSLTENSNEARYCNEVYDGALTVTLRDHYWNFASRRVEPAEVTKPDTYVEFSNMFDYPADCIKVEKVLDDTGTEVPFSVVALSSGGYDTKGIATNTESPILVYTKYVDDVKMFDSGFVEAFSFRIAADLAWPLSRDSDLERSMLTKYAAALPSAMSTDAQEGKREAEPEDTWITSRWS